VAMEAIQKVTQVEQATSQRWEAILAENKQKIAVAQRSAQRVLEEGRLEAEAEARQLMVLAEREAAQSTKELLEQTERENEALKQAARAKLGQAAELIVEKVVKH